VLRGSAEDLEQARELFDLCGAVSDLTKLGERQRQA
jgi:hypothetical protein